MVTLSDLEQPVSGNNTIDSLLGDGPLWEYLVPAQTALTFAFAESDVVSEDSEYVETPLPQSQRDAVFTALAHATDVTGIQFDQISDPLTADLVFAGADLDSETAGMTVWASGYFFMDEPDTDDDPVTEYSIDAFIYMDNSENDYSAEMEVGEYGYYVLIHELGHALGLKHPGHYEPTDVPPYLPDADDTMDNTVMSYNEGNDGPPSVFQEYDLLALDYLYGGDGLGGTSGVVADSDADGDGDDTMDAGEGDDTTDDDDIAPDDDDTATDDDDIAGDDDADESEDDTPETDGGGDDTAMPDLGSDSDVINLQRGIVGAGTGDDVYLVSGSLIDDGTDITLSDGQGTNYLQFIAGLQIASSAVAANTLQLTTDDGAVITVLDASGFTYVLGGNPLAGTFGPQQDFETFVTETLGYDALPTTGTDTSDTGITIA